MKAANYAMLIVDLSAFLESYQPGKKEFTSKELLIIQSGIDFLEKVLRGQEIITSQNALVPDVRDITAYSFVHQALRLGTDGGQFIQIEDKRKLFQNTLFLLEQIQQGVEMPSLSRKEINDVRILLKRMATFALVETTRDSANQYWTLLAVF